MKNIKDIFNETLNESALVEKSLYFKSGNKVVRFSDHLAKIYNIEENNEGVEEILFVLISIKACFSKSSTFEITLSVETVCQDKSKDAAESISVNV